MAVAFDAYSRHADGFTSSLSWSHTCAGSDRYLIVFISIRSSQDRVSGITYNGSAMTRLDYANNGALGVYLYGVVAPATGAHNVVATLSAGVAADSAAMSFTGVDQTTPTNDIDSNINGFKNSPAQLSLTTLSGGMGVSFVSSSDDKSNTYSPESGQTQAGQSDSSLDLVASGYKADASTVGWTWTGGNSKNMGHSVAALSPASGGGSSLALTGISSTAAVGSLAFTKTGTLALSGVASTTAVGTVAPSSGTALALTGVAATGAAGSMAFSKSGSLALTGIAAACAVGSVGIASGAASFACPAMMNNTESLLLNTAVSWSWFPGWRVGNTLAGITPVHGTGTTHASTGVLTLTGLAAGAGLAIVTKRNTDPTDDDVYYAAGTAA